MRGSSALVFVFILFCLPGGANGEIYKYRDQNGVLRFTDDFTEVPPEQRPKVESYPQVEDFRRTALPASDAGASQAEAGEAGRESAEEEARAGEAEDRYRALNERKARLDAEYQALAEAQALLLEERKAADTPGKQRAVNEKVLMLNERIAAFEKRRSAFEEEVRAYTAQN